MNDSEVALLFAEFGLLAAKMLDYIKTVPPKYDCNAVHVLARKITACTEGQTNESVLAVVCALVTELTMDYLKSYAGCLSKEAKISSN